MDEDPKSEAGLFDFVTSKQAAVLDLLANNRTSKEIGFALGISEAAVNRRIEVLRSRLGGVTRHELARRYRDWLAKRDAGPCVETEMRNLPLAAAGCDDEKPSRDSHAADLAFQDSFDFRIDAPWDRDAEPRVVPGVLDGANAMFTRGVAIAAIMLAIVVSLVLGLAVAQGLAEIMR